MIVYTAGLNHLNYTLFLRGHIQRNKQIIFHFSASVCQHVDNALNRSN